MTTQDQASRDERVPKGMINMAQPFAISPEPLRFLRVPPSAPFLEGVVQRRAQMRNLLLELDESVSLFASRELDG